MPKPLSIDKAVDGNLKPVKDSDGTITALEISTDNVRVKNDLEVLGNLTASNIGTLTDIVYCGFSGLSGKMYLPLNGYILERSTTASSNEYISIVAPYSGVVRKVVMRSEAVCGSTVVGFHKAAEGTENPNHLSPTEAITLDMAVDDTAYTFEFTDTASFNAGDILAISFDPTSTSYDTNGTVVLRYNV